MSSKRDLITVINKSAEELHQQIEMYRYLMAAILEKRVGDESIKQIAWTTDSPNEKKFKEAFRETIEVLEESRQAFKSKRLETLRKKLIRLLVETE